MISVLSAVAGMYGKKSVKHKKDSTKYKDFYYYGCKHRTMLHGYKCDYKKQINEDLLDNSVSDIIIKLVRNPKFASMMQDKINMQVDTAAIEQELANYEKQLISARAKKQSVEAEKLTSDNICKVLICFERLYAVMNDAEKRQLIEALVSEIQIYDERQSNGQWIKSIKFKLPIIEENMDICLDNDEHVECIAVLKKAEQ